MLIIIVQAFFFLTLTWVLLGKQHIGLLECFFLVFISGASYGLYSSLKIYLSVLMAVICIMYAYLHNRNMSQSIIIVMEAIIISVIVDHLSTISILLIHQKTWYLGFYSVLQVIVNILLFQGVTTGKVKPTFKKQYLNRYIAPLLVIVHWYIIGVEGNQNGFNIIVGNLSILLVIIAFFLAIHSEYLKNLKVKYEVQKQQAQIKNDARYMSEIETHYNELRQFRHEYQNMLISIDEYLKTDDLKGLQDYYHSNLEPVSERVLKDKYSLEDLSRIKIKSIKSIFFNKLSYAQSRGIETHFESKKELEVIDLKELDLVIALGIILDNAIEASVGHEGSEIMSGIFSTHESITFVIQNNIYEELPPVWQLKEVGFSTKGEGRGLGLDSLSKLVSRNGNMVLETRSLETVFLQRLTVQRINNND